MLLDDAIETLHEAVEAQIADHVTGEPADAAELPRSGIAKFFDGFSSDDFAGQCAGRQLIFGNVAEHIWHKFVIEVRVDRDERNTGLLQRLDGSGHANRIVGVHDHDVDAASDERLNVLVLAGGIAVGIQHDELGADFVGLGLATRNHGLPPVAARQAALGPADDQPLAHCLVVGLGHACETGDDRRCRTKQHRLASNFDIHQCFLRLMFLLSCNQDFEGSVKTPRFTSS